MIARFKAYLETLNAQLSQLADFEDSKADLSAVINQNNCRIKIEETPEDRERRRNTLHNERKYYNKIDDEDDYVNGQRQELLRNN